MFTRNEELLSLHKFKQMTSGLGMYFFSWFILWCLKIVHGSLLIQIFCMF